ncbi:hypothetical protein B0H16DRAFT_1469646 [Mycena metata]|uniref:Uncharacterized protein n=1 Tax=Mycena metata TaxID=1033252 RepID=A0AAD7MSP4_9AGAR|nr:hypothetical protein B0H16DRAFT_1469646 [Mycena metata]
MPAGGSPNRCDSNRDEDAGVFLARGGNDPGPSSIEASCRPGAHGEGQHLHDPIQRLCGQGVQADIYFGTPAGRVSVKWNVDVPDQVVNNGIQEGDVDGELSTPAIHGVELDDEGVWAMCTANVLEGAYWPQSESGVWRREYSSKAPIQAREAVAWTDERRSRVQECTGKAIGVVGIGTSKALRSDGNVSEEYRMNLNDIHASESEQAWVAKDRWEARGCVNGVAMPGGFRTHTLAVERKGICWRSATGYWVEGGRYMSVRVGIQTTPAILCARNGAAEEGGITKQIVRRSLQSWRIKIPAWWERNLDTRRGRGVTVLIQIEGAHKGRAAVAEGIAQSQVMWSPEAEGQHKERDGGERVVLVQGQE